MNRVIIKRIIMVIVALILVTELVSIPTREIEGAVSSEDGVFYIKDNNLNYTAFPEMKHYKVVNDTKSGSDFDSLFDTHKFGDLVKISKDSKRVFYPIYNIDDEYKLYYIDINDNRSRATLIDTHIAEYQINNDGTKICFTKWEYNKSKDEYYNDLYFSDFKKNEKLCKDVQRFYLDQSGDNLVYMSTDGIYIKEKSKKTIKFDYNFNNKDISVDLLNYIKDEFMYYGGVVIPNYVDSIMTMYESGDYYYCKNKSAKLALYDFVNDDLIKTDASMKKPIESNYKSKKNYQQDLNKYKNKLERDKLRTLLKKKTIIYETSSLYYYNGKKSTLITDYYADSWDHSYVRPRVIYYYENRRSKESQFKISEISSVDEVYECVTNSDISPTAMYMAIGTKIIKLDSPMEDIVINENEDALYYTGDFNNSDNIGNLYKRNIQGTSLKAPILYDEGVSTMFFIGDSMFYLKNNSDLYFNKEFVDTNVSGYRNESIGDTSSYLYFTNYNEDNQCGTLKVFNGKDVTQINEIVYDYYVLNSQYIIYLKDYDRKSSKGSLYLYNGQDNILIDEGVTAFLGNKY